MKLHDFPLLVSMPLLVNTQSFDSLRVGTVILEGEVGYVLDLSAEELGVLNRPFMVYSYRSAKLCIFEQLSCSLFNFVSMPLSLIAEHI